MRHRSPPQAGQAFSAFEVVLDLDPLQVLGQLLPAVLVAVFHPPGDELLARLLGNAGRIQRHLIDLLAEQQAVAAGRTLAARAVVAARMAAMAAFISAASFTMRRLSFDLLGRFLRMCSRSASRDDVLRRRVASSAALIGQRGGRSREGRPCSSPFIPRELKKFRSRRKIFIARMRRGGQAREQSQETLLVMETAGPSHGASETRPVRAACSRSPGRSCPTTGS